MPKIIFTILFLLLLPLFPATADSNPIDVHVFTRTGCPYCAQTVSFLETLKASEYPELKIHEYDVTAKPAYAAKLLEFASAYSNVNTDHVPITFVGKKAITGFYPNEIKATIENCRVSSCVNPDGYVAEQLKNNPNNNIPNSNGGREFLGWIVLGVVVVGLGLVIVNKKL